MTDAVLNVVLGLLTSAIGASAAWLLQTVRRRRRTARLQAFFGLPGGSEGLLVVNRHMKGNDQSVHREDVSALMELAVLINSCGATPDIVAHDEVRQGLGQQAEFCLGGPASNDRSAAHLAWRLPGVRFDYDPDTGPITLVGDQEYRRRLDNRPTPACAFALLSRLDPGDGGRPVFLIVGQTAVANHAAVRYLTGHHRELARRHGVHGTFALVLRVVNPARYGPDVVELVGDVTTAATTPAPTPAPTATPTATATTAPTGTS
jgi:hypothetical protein